MSIQERLNQCLQSMNLDPITTEEQSEVNNSSSPKKKGSSKSKKKISKKDSSKESKKKNSSKKGKKSSSKKDKNKAKDANSKDASNNSKDESNNSKDESTNSKDAKSLFDQDLSYQDKIRYDELISLEVKKRVELYLELNKMSINRNFIDREKELKELEAERTKLLKETKIELKNKRDKLNLKINKHNKIKTMLILKEQELNQKECQLEEEQSKLQRSELEFDQKINEERCLLTKEFSKLTKLKEYFESDDENEYIKLNVGGTSFETTTRMLKTHSSYFNGLLSGRFKVMRDSKNDIFIDRSPDLFRRVIKIIRNLDRGCKINMKISDSLAKELDYFLININ